MRRPLLAVFLLAAPLAVLVQDPEPKGPKVGQAAPVIRLNDHEGKAATVGGKSKTWSVLAFYPKAATPG